MTHVPVRMCVVCRTRRPASELLRAAADAGRIVPAATVNVQGRGAYLCRNAECIRRAEKKKLLERHLGIPAADGLYRQMEDMI